MIKHIHASAFFPTSGATLSGDFQPQSGITAVVGENGVGKTFLTIETTRWLLFGKSALRGMATDYKTAEAKGTFTIRGADYTISRGRVEEIRSGDEVLAKGAEKVTERVEQLLGYGLDVFDLCNAATQGNVQDVGKMRPAERKALIDSVLKLTDAETAEKDCRAEAKGYKREAETLAGMLRAPGDKPAVGEDPARLRQELDDARVLFHKHAQLSVMLRPIDRPALPAVGKFSEEDIAALQAHEDKRQQTEGTRRFLELTIAQRPARPQHTDHIIEQGLRVHFYEQAVAERGEAPTLTLDEIEKGRAAWEERGNALLASDVQATCPECGHSFRVGGEVPDEPAVAEIDLLRAEQAHERWAKPLPLRSRGDETAKAITPGEADQLRAEARQHQAVRNAEIELEDLKSMDDRSDELQQMRQDKATMEAFTMQLLNYERVEQNNEQVRAEIAKLDRPMRQQEIDDLADDLRTAEIMAEKLRTWEREDAEYRATQDKIIEANRLAAEFKAGADDISKARATVKALIAPKISRIATGLIRDMSLNKLKDLIIDDNMEITVGGQRMETLSGAGKTVANLALRIAMGRALVGHVFPVFLADEIDGDMTPKRREATLQALVSLKQHIKQIVLVTHRGADIADHICEITG